MIRLSLEDYPDLEAAQNHVFIGDFCLNLAHGRWQFGMGLNGVACYCHALQFQLLFWAINTLTYSEFSEGPRKV